MSGGEIFVIILVAIMLFGTKGIPEIARTLGKGMREFKKATDEIKKEITETKISKDIDKLKDIDALKDIDKHLKG